MIRQDFASSFSFLSCEVCILHHFSNAVLQGVQSFSYRKIIARPTARRRRKCPTIRRRARERLLASPPFPLAAAVCICCSPPPRPTDGSINNGVLCLVSERIGPQASDVLVPRLEGWMELEIVRRGWRVGRMNIDLASWLHQLMPSRNKFHQTTYKTFSPNN